MATVMSRNTRPGPTVFVDPQTKTTIEWGGKDDPDGRDIQPVPSDLLEHPKFLSVVHQGVIVIEEDDDPDVKAKMERQSGLFDRREKARASDAASVMEAEDSSKDIVFQEREGGKQHEVFEEVPNEQAPRTRQPSAEETPEPMQVYSETGEVDEDGRPIQEPVDVTFGDPLPDQQ